MLRMSNEEPTIGFIIIRDPGHFARVLRATRNMARLTQSDVADRLGLSRSTIAFREQVKGGTDPRRSITIADAVAQLDVCGYRLAVIPK